MAVLAACVGAAALGCATGGTNADDDAGNDEDVIVPGFDAAHVDKVTIDNYVPPLDSSKDTTINDAPVDMGTKDAAPSCPTCPLKVQYLCADNNATDNQMKPHYNIINLGGSAQAMDELTVRYYTIDGVKAQSYYCDYATIGCGNITSAFVAMDGGGVPEAGADYYMEIGFTSGAGSLAADGGQSGEIQNRFNKTDYSNISQSNDYSFDPTKLSFADWDHVTLYKNGSLVWGTEP